MEYKTVEGHPIVRDGVYETRGGKKVTILGFRPDRMDNMVGYIDGGAETAWKSDGSYSLVNASCLDLMRPWKDKQAKPTDKKVYRLKDMWIGWYYSKKMDCYCQGIAPVSKKESLPRILEQDSKIIAITSADATEFYEGQGLE